MGALGTAVDDAVDHELPPECAKMMHDIVFRSHLDVIRRALLGDPPARVEPMTVRLQPGTRAVRFFIFYFYFFFVYLFFKSYGGWVKIKLELPHFHVSDTCRVSI